MTEILLPKELPSFCHYTLLCEFVHNETMANASNAMRVIQLRHGARSETILIFDIEIDADFAQNVKAKACTTFDVNIETGRLARA